MKYVCEVCANLIREKEVICQTTIYSPRFYHLKCWKMVVKEALGK